MAVKKKGGFTIVQQPEDAENQAMPKAAIELVKPHKVLTLDEIIAFLSKGDFCLK